MTHELDLTHETIIDTARLSPYARIDVVEIQDPAGEVTYKVRRVDSLETEEMWPLEAAQAAQRLRDYAPSAIDKEKWLYRAEALEKAAKVADAYQHIADTEKYRRYEEK